MTENKHNEAELIRERYAKRSSTKDNRLYCMLSKSFYMEAQERERRLINLFTSHDPLEEKTVIEIGCGDGSKIIELIRLGFMPQNITANELLPESIEKAKQKLPGSVRMLEGDATKIEVANGSFDFVYQSTVFTSILDRSSKKRLADKMWGWLKPGGMIIWYDFTYDNPTNKDVQGVPLSDIKKLFPEAIIRAKKLTLAPPINRIVTNIHPSFYTIFNSFPFLRTHILCSIQKRT